MLSYTYSTFLIHIAAIYVHGSASSIDPTLSGNACLLFIGVCCGDSILRDTDSLGRHCDVST